MAATVEQIKTIAGYCVDLANAAKSLKYLSAQLLANNSALAVDWASLPAAAVDADGKIDGTSISPAEVSNVIGSLDAYATLWAAGHGGNFEKLAKAIV
jgi:hypothetical protein